MGSVIVGSRALIDRAVRVRKVRRGVTWTPDILIEIDYIVWIDIYLSM